MIWGIYAFALLLEKLSDSFLNENKTNTEFWLNCICILFVFVFSTENCAYLYLLL